MSTCQEHERPRLPIPVGHFNPSILMWQDRLILATRDSWGHSKVALWELVNTKSDWTREWSAVGIGSFGSDHPQAPRLEDPRLFTARDETGRIRLCSAFNLPDGYPPKFVQVGYVTFRDDLSGIESTKVYQSPSCSVYEKNWSPFYGDARQGLRWVYAMKPDHVILDESGGILCTSRNDLPWTGGVMRGGAAPVYHNGVYYVFFHGCLKVTKGNVYTVGCYTFDPASPHRILKQTAVPLLWPDLPGPGESVTKRYVCWVGGAVAHAGAFHLAIGVDDTFSRIVRIPFANVEAALSDIPETQSGRVTSIRSTAIGTQRSNK